MLTTENRSRSSAFALAAAAGLAATAALRAQGTIAFTANPVPQTNAPQGLEGHALAVRADGSMVLFGGEQAAGLLPGTFTSSNGTWTRRISILNPTERSEATLAFDSVRNDTLLFGGKDTFGNALGDTWTGGGVAWVQLPGGISALVCRKSQAMGRNVRTNRGMRYRELRHVWRGSDFQLVATFGPAQGSCEDLGWWPPSGFWLCRNLTWINDMIAATMVFSGIFLDGARLGSLIVVEGGKSGMLIAAMVLCAVAVVCLIYYGMADYGRKKALFKSVEAWRGAKNTLRMSNADGTQWEDWIRQGQFYLAIINEGKVTRCDYTLEVKKGIEDDMRVYELARAHASMQHSMVNDGQSRQLSDLARLRSEGMISQDEFAAFTARFTKSGALKALEVIHAIEALHRQKTAGAMSEGNYHASLWSLMDRIDRDLR